MKRTAAIVLVFLMLLCMSASAFSFRFGNNKTGVEDDILPFDGRVYCGSADGKYLLAFDKTQRTTGILKTGKKKLTALEPDDSLRDELIRTMVFSYRQWVKDSEKLAAYEETLTKQSTRELLLNAEAAIGMLIGNVLSVNNDIAVCECLNGSFFAAIDLTSGKMCLCPSIYQTQDGRLLTEEGMYDMRSGTYTDTNLRLLLENIGYVKTGIMTDANSGCFLLMDSEDGIWTYYMARVEQGASAGRQELWSYSISELSKAPSGMYLSGDGTVCVYTSAGRSLTLCYPDGRVVYFDIDVEKGKCVVTDAPSGDGIVELYGFLPDGRLLGMERINCSLFAIDSETFQYSTVLKNSKLPDGFLRGKVTSLCADRLYYYTETSTGYITIK